MSENIILDYDAFLRSIKTNKDTYHSFLLGAGASIGSGIKSASECIWEWKKDIYLSKHPDSSDFYKNIQNDSVKNSIQNWLDNEGSYPLLNSKEEYSFYAEKAYPISGDRRKYFQSLIDKKEPYIGYKLLCLLNEKEIVSAVWTTNFDGLIVKAAYQESIIPIEITLDSADRIFRNQSKKELLTIALHGDYKYETLKNTTKELDSQNEIFVDALARYHIDKNLVVIGYSGRDKSLMDSLQKAFCQSGSGRLYWCGFGHEIGVPVRKLINRIKQSGREAFFIPTDGFDKTLLHLSKACFENDKVVTNKISKMLDSIAKDDLETTKFSLNIDRTDKYIKSNLHPISFPKEIFQFEVDFGIKKPWKTLKLLGKKMSYVQSHIEERYMLYLHYL